MKARYVGFGNLNEEAKTRIQMLIDEYAFRAGYSSNNMRLVVTVKSSRRRNVPYFEVTIRLKANAAPVFSATADNQSLARATEDAFDYLEEQMLYDIAQNDMKGENYGEHAVLG